MSAEGLLTDAEIDEMLAEHLAEKYDWDADDDNMDSAAALDPTR